MSTVQAPQVPRVADLLGAGQVEVVSERIEQRDPGFQGGYVRLAVDLEGHVHRARPGHSRLSLSRGFIQHAGQQPRGGGAGGGASSQELAAGERSPRRRLGLRRRSSLRRRSGLLDALVAALPARRFRIPGLGHRSPSGSSFQDGDYNSRWWNPRERRGRRGARLTRRAREEYRVYFDRSATMSGAQRRGNSRWWIAGRAPTGRTGPRGLHYRLFGRDGSPAEPPPGELGRVGFTTGC